jgi:hypothetical protein
MADSIAVGFNQRIKSKNRIGFSRSWSTILAKANENRKFKLRWLKPTAIDRKSIKQLLLLLLH